MTGLSVLRHLAASDHLTLIDTRADVVPESVRSEYPQIRLLLGQRARLAIEALGELAAEFDRAVVSPGLDDQHWLLQHLRASGVPMCTDIDLFFDAVVNQPSAMVIGVTGTNGKSTVTALTAALLSAAGVSAVAGGNLGPAALDLLSTQSSVYVLELSSFQLARSKESAFAAATILNLQPDHLDYHGSMAAYAAAKQRIYGAASVVVCNRDDPETAPKTSALKASEQDRWSFGLDAPASRQTGIAAQQGQRWLSVFAETMATPLAVLDTAALQLAGRHNEGNVLAALALAFAVAPENCTSEVAQIASMLRDYRGLAHRCERLGAIEGVQYINDSKATNVGATVAAIAGLRGLGPLLLLLGGDGKGADFSALADAVTTGVRGAFVYGAAAGQLEDVLGTKVATVRVETLFGALSAAREQAQPGDCVLLSPACASFDQFANFEARGDAFRSYVQELAA